MYIQVEREERREEEGRRDKFLQKKHTDQVDMRLDALKDPGTRRPPPGSVPPPARPTAADEAAEQAAQLEAASKGFDPGEFQRQQEESLKVQKAMFGGEEVDKTIYNQQVMRDAKKQGLQGNMMMDEGTGRMVIKSEDEMGGSAGRYWWGQNEGEVCIKCRVGANVKKRGVQLVTNSKTVLLRVEGELICEGPLFAPIISDESTFSLEDQFEPAEAAGAVEELSGRLLTVTLTKAEITRGQGHWTSAVQGEAEIKKSTFGPSMVTLSPHNPAEIQEHLAKIK